MFVKSITIGAEIINEDRELLDKNKSLTELIIIKNPLETPKVMDYSVKRMQESSHDNIVHMEVTDSVGIYTDDMVAKKARPSRDLESPIYEIFYEYDYVSNREYIEELYEKIKNGDKSSFDVLVHIADYGVYLAQIKVMFCYFFCYLLPTQYECKIIFYRESSRLWLEEQVVKGDMFAQYDLAVCYSHGVGCLKNEVKAFSLYNLSAIQGDNKAQYELGLCYEYGIGIPSDIQKSTNAYLRSANQKNTNAQFKLACCYRYGISVRRNFKQSACFYSLAADKGHAQAQYNLGICYEYGEGVRKNIKKAAYYYQRAAEQGYAKARFKLAICYEYGKGIRKNINKAIEWYRKV